LGFVERGLALVANAKRDRPRRRRPPPKVENQRLLGHLSCFAISSPRKHTLSSRREQSDRRPSPVARRPSPVARRTSHAAPSHVVRTSALPHVSTSARKHVCT